MAAIALTVTVVDYAAHIDAVIAHAEPVVVPIAAVKAHTEAATTHMEAVTAHQDPFETTATTHEKMAKQF